MPRHRRTRYGERDSSGGLASAELLAVLARILCALSEVSHSQIRWRIAEPVKNVRRPVDGTKKRLNKSIAPSATKRPHRRATIWARGKFGALGLVTWSPLLACLHTLHKSNMNHNLSCAIALVALRRGKAGELVSISMGRLTSNLDTSSWCAGAAGARYPSRLAPPSPATWSRAPRTRHASFTLTHGERSDGVQTELIGCSTDTQPVRTLRSRFTRRCRLCPGRNPPVGGRH